MNVIGSLFRRESHYREALRRAVNIAEQKLKTWSYRRCECVLWWIVYWIHPPADSLPFKTLGFHVKSISHHGLFSQNIPLLRGSGGFCSFVLAGVWPGIGPPWEKGLGSSVQNLCSWPVEHLLTQLPLGFLLEAPPPYCPQQVKFWL